MYVAVKSPTTILLSKLSFERNKKSFKLKECLQKLL